MTRHYTSNVSRAPAQRRQPEAPPRVFVENVLTYCPVCEKWIAHEDGHGCPLAPDVREERNAERAAKITSLRLAGVTIADTRSSRRG